MKDGTRALLMQWTEEFSRSAAGSWLLTFRWQVIPFDWNGRCNTGSGVMGCYGFGRIGLMNLENVPEKIWPTYIHELYHRWQWTHKPLTYIAGKLFRPLIERPADRMTELADDWIGSRI